MSRRVLIFFVVFLLIMPSISFAFSANEGRHDSTMGYFDFGEYHLTELTVWTEYNVNLRPSGYVEFKTPRGILKYPFEWKVTTPSDGKEKHYYFWLRNFAEPSAFRIVVENGGVVWAVSARTSHPDIPIVHFQPSSGGNTGGGDGNTGGG
ncbi:hypothetical protein, partial [Brevibacillus daliensis]|uniref:hypothetical protein n=1 Tax=Brevibacillus daliensis TaxID=2892995 RepID=UPI001E313DA6